MASAQALRQFINERLTAAAAEIFTVFEQTIAQYEEEIDRHRRLLEINRTSQVHLHRIELPQHHDSREEQHLEEQTNYCVEQEEPEPPRIKEENEEPELLQFKHEREEPELPQIKEESGFLQFEDDWEEPEPSQIEEPEELDTSQEGDLLVLNVTSIEEQTDHHEPEDVPGTEQSPSHDSEDHDGKNGLDSESAMAAGQEQTEKSEKQTESQRFLCKICGKRFSHSKLLVHMRTHTGEKPHSCKTCGKCFSRHYLLQRHMNVHTNEKPYSCETCGKCFKAQWSLKSHRKTHLAPEKPFSCENCGARFTRQGNLVVHMRIHTGEKPYSCEICGKKVNVKSNLLVHMRTHKEMES